MNRLDLNISFTPTVEAAFGKDNVIIVKDTKGGQPIRQWYKEWKTSSGHKPKGNGDLYDRLMTKVTAAIEGKKIATVTFLWMQGAEASPRGAFGQKIKNDVHYSVEGYKTFGKRLAEKAIELIKNNAQ